MKEQPFKKMQQGEVLVIPYNVKLQKYVHAYAAVTDKIFRTKQIKKGWLTITRKL